VFLNYVKNEFTPFLQTMLNTTDHQQLVELKGPKFDISSLSESVKDDLTKIDLMSLPMQLCEKLGTCHLDLGIYGQDSPKALIQYML